MEQFEWKPGRGIDVAALARLREHCVKPRASMGEGWFMGERRIFDELQGDLSTLPARDLRLPLGELASGTSSFGPLREWEEWYRYLLAQLLPRSHEASVSSLTESLVTGFMALYPNGVQAAPYRQFLDDVLLTLGQCMMEPGVWNGADIVVGAILQRSNDNPSCVWCWWDASGDLSASMFFCLKYLPSQCISKWLQSVFAISSPHWRAQIVAWLVGSYPVLSGQLHWPSEFPENSRPSVSWESSHCIRPELAGADGGSVDTQIHFFPDSSRILALQLIHDYFTDEVFLDWLDSISAVPYLMDELAEIPSTFEQLYVHPTPN